MRTDIHRKGAIVPADYEIVLSYSTGNVSGPAMGVNCEAEIIGYRPTANGGGGRSGETPIYGQHAAGKGCCVVALRERGDKFAEHGRTGRCTACGAAFVYGDLWRHNDGTLIHVGHVCAHKYGLLTDRSAFELALGRRHAAHAAAVQRTLNDEARAAVLEANPGLEAAFEVNHHIVADIRARFVRTCRVSPAQIALVLKLADEIKNPRPKPAAERNVAAPTGRVTFRGVVVSAKWHSSNYGDTLKITVKVQTPDGCWLAWCTAPTALLEANRAEGKTGVDLRGREVELTATLKPGRESHFAFGKRPSGGKFTDASAPEKPESNGASNGTGFTSGPTTCGDCGRSGYGYRTGHQECEYPQNH